MRPVYGTWQENARRFNLRGIKSNGDIFFAWADRKWYQEGAAVQVSMVGFDDGSELVRTLDSIPVATISTALTTGSDMTKAYRLVENQQICLLGTFKVGSFDIPRSIATEFLKLPANPSGRPNSDVVLPWVNGLDVTRRLRDMWIINFRDRSEEDASLYEAPFEYVRQVVKPERDKNRRDRRRIYWWQHGETSPALYAALDTLSRYIATPYVAKHRLFVWITNPTLPDHQLAIFTRDDDYFFGVLHAKVHELWARAMGTQLREAESGFRYTPSTTFETYPFPWPPGQEPQGDPRVEEIAAAARRLVELRDAWLSEAGLGEAELRRRTLTNLYNQRPEWLDAAHRQLDAAVCAAYGWPADLGDEQILARLLALNLERAGYH